MPPPSRMTDSAMTSRSRVETPGWAACRTARSALATRAPAAAMESSSPAVRWGTALRPRRWSSPIIGLLAESAQRAGEHLVEIADGVDGLEFVGVVVQQRCRLGPVDVHPVEDDLFGVVGASPA